ncbi:MAG: outer membrane lipoprotein LolB [Rubrivivax sp.]|nr:outer membrane lipoprotein LolB [Rubrivivax sp.]
MAGCATAPQPSSDQAAWTSGRLSLRVEATSERIVQSLSVVFELRGGADSGELRLTSPLGTQVAAAQWSPGQASLRTSEGERQFADLDALSRQALGETLPLAALPDWLAGRPWRGAAHRAQATGFEQLGWVVETNRLAEGWVSATREAAPTLKLRVRLDRPEA